MKLKNYILLFFSLFIVISAQGETLAWMEDIPDATKVRSMSIPGAHDAATGHGFSGLSWVVGLVSGKTQSKKLDALFDAGVRAFDLRPTHKKKADGQLKIYHGSLETNLTMKEALNQLRDKLIANPTEFVIIVVRHENDSDDDASAWLGAMTNLLADYEEYLVKFTPSLNVGAARGKMLFLTRDAFESDYAGLIEGWTHSENFDEQKNAQISLGRSRSTLVVQDYYDCESNDRKTATIQNVFDYAINNTDESTWVINHTSGYVSVGTETAVKNLAKVTNQYMVDALKSKSVDGRTGIVMMDYAADSEYDKGLVEAIINNNEYFKTPPISAVETISENVSQEDDYIYSIYGVVVGEGNDALSTLPAGIYIKNGKKILVK